jgi:hypothetical protein
MMTYAQIVGVSNPETPRPWFWGATVPETTGLVPDTIEGGILYADFDAGCPLNMRDNTTFDPDQPPTKKLPD